MTGAFLVLIILGAKIDLDFGEKVSFTLQTLFLSLGYYFLPLRFRLGLIATYLLLGALGLSVFNGGEGIDYVLSHPLGFFLGFVVSSFIPAPKEFSLQSVFLYFIVLHIIILSLGTLWLVYYLGLSKAVDIATSLSLGMVIKSAVGAGVVLAVSKLRV